MFSSAKKALAKKMFLSFLSGLLLICVSLTGCTSGSATDPKWEKLKAAFKDNGKNEPYSQQIPLNQMDFSVYDKYFPHASTAGYNPNIQRSIPLPADINYYSSPDDNAKPVLTLKKGTVIFMTPSDYRPYCEMYGLHCFPDYKKGWRYGIPFVTHDFTASDLLAMKDAYYVKTDELKPIAAAYYDANSKPFSEQTSAQFVIGTIQDRDYSLYTGGCFCSPEFSGFYGTDY